MIENIETNDETETPNDGFNVVDEVGLREWVDYENEGIGQFIHVVIGKAGNWRLYKTVNDEFPSERVQTTLRNVKFRPNHDLNAGQERERLNPRRDDDIDEVTGFYITGGQAQSFISAMDLLEREDEANGVTVTWYQDNGKPAHNDLRIFNEDIIFNWRDEAGQRRGIHVQDTWQDKSQQMAQRE